MTKTHQGAAEDAVKALEALGQDQPWADHEVSAREAVSRLRAEAEAALGIGSLAPAPAGAVTLFSALGLSASRDILGIHGQALGENPALAQLCRGALGVRTVRREAARRAVPEHAEAASL